jgi:hypothetical protein
MDARQKSELGQQLLDAAWMGDLSKVESLVAQGAAVNYRATIGVRVYSPYGVTVISILLCVFLFV